MGEAVTRWIVFTDLDESLLDSETYSFEAARPALEELARRGIPVVYVTSKTMAETVALQRRMEIAAPIVVEGGGGIAVPKGLFGALAGAKDRGAHDLVALSAPYEEVLRGLGHLKEFTANSIRGFDDMTVEEVAELTRLPREAATLAKEREFDEPFRFVRREAEFAAHLPRVAREVGLRVSRGARFFHLHGDTDKGRAVAQLKSLYGRALGPVRTMGLGDSEMDLPLLAETDVPVIIPRRDGAFDTVLALGVPKARRATSPGPRGWNDAVLALLADESR
jgi:mannosyl-3-phosphoglycerate phosphatase